MATCHWLSERGASSPEHSFLGFYLLSWWEWGQIKIKLQTMTQRKFWPGISIFWFSLSTMSLSVTTIALNCCNMINSTQGNSSNDSTQQSSIIMWIKVPVMGMMRPLPPVWLFNGYTDRFIIILSNCFTVNWLGKEHVCLKDIFPQGVQRIRRVIGKWPGYRPQGVADRVLQYHQIPSNTMQYQGVSSPRSVRQSAQYHQLPSNTIKYLQIPSNTFKYHKKP